MAAMRSIALAGVALLLLAGCASSPTPTATETSTEEPTEAPAFELHGCDGTFFSVFTDDGPVREALPDGYRPYMVQGAAVAGVDLEAYVCESILVGTDHYEGVPMSILRVPVRAPEYETGQDSYVFGWMFDVEQAPALAAWLDAHGWPVQDATVTVGVGEASIVGADVDYQVLDAGEKAGQEPISATWSATEHRMHHHGPDGVHSVLNQHYSMGDPTGATAMHVLATKGPLAGFTRGGAGTLAPGIASNHLRLDAAFDDRLEPGELPA